MAGWRKWFGRGDDDAASPSLDPPEVSASRVESRQVEAKRAKAIADWTRVKAQGSLGPRITREDVEQTLAGLGYKKRRVQGESLFAKQAHDRTISLWVSLKTFGEADLFAPMQRLLLSGSMTTQGYAAVEAEIIGSGPRVHVSMATVDQREIEDYVLAAPQVVAAVNQIEQEIMGIAPDQVLAGFRNLETSCSGAAGPRHLAALALAGDIDTLDGYVRRRRDGDPCGFVPFITDDMIICAAKIGHRYG